MSHVYDRILPWEMWVAGRHINELQYISKFGRNEDVDFVTTGPEDVWVHGGLYTGFPDAADIGTVDVVSTSAADAVAGAGMQTIFLQGLGADLKQQVELLDMAGTAPGVTSGKQWFRLNRAFGVDAGATGTNEGVITISHTATPANIFATIDTGFGQTEIAAYTCPLDRRMVLSARTLSVSNPAGSAKEGRIAWVTRDNEASCWRTRSPIAISSEAAPHVAGRYAGMLAMDPLDDVVLRVISGAADNLAVTAEFDIYLSPLTVPFIPSLT